MNAALELAGVRLGYGRGYVLQNVSFTIRSGEFIGVLGPNGSGKTTLLRAVLGLIPPSAGAIRTLGYPAKRGNPEIGYLPQQGGLMLSARLSGWDVLASAAGPRRWGLPWPNASERAALHRALALTDAAALASRPMSTLSGGERQRLRLAGALLGEPRLLLLDEPLASLDLRRQGAFVERVRNLQGRLGMTVLFTAHDINALLAAVDRVLYLGHGQAALGTVEEVITGPVLSRLYGVPVEVVRMAGRIAVLAPGTELQDQHVTV
ncbi:MAG: ATP-binding cassette domain-containing protein [Acetobacteraceae bacterium]|nr:ATP-binding cassette domain-containing protein [Acetobacteraceae bacterium]MBV8591648.1 ATP-binding cassette domain-containing protein [Acetobacteraceae bacterium]